MVVPEEVLSRPPYDPDIIEVLADEHGEAVQLLDQLRATSAPGPRRAIFRDLCRALARHEVGEEEVVYPVLHRLGGEAEKVRLDRLAEEQGVKKLLARMNRQVLLNPGGTRFGRNCGRLARQVAAHATAEEETVFPLLRQVKDPQQLRIMATLFKAASKTAPGRAHPHVSGKAPSLFLAGPFLAVSDRLRDLGRRWLGA